LIGASRYRLDVEGPMMQQRTRLDMDLLELPSVYLESEQYDAPSLWKQPLDRLYNAFGRNGSPFWRDGAWTARRI
jgi:hypothetical protein